MKVLSRFIYFTFAILVFFCPSWAVAEYVPTEEEAQEDFAKETLRKLIVAQEVYFIEAKHYATCSGASCEKLKFFKLPDSIELSTKGSSSGFTIQVKSKGDTGKTFTYDSEEGRIRSTE